MTTNMTTIDESNSFVLRRSLTNGFVSEIDPDVREFLDELNTLLSKRIFKAQQPAAAKAHTEVEEEALIRHAIQLAEHEQKLILGALGQSRTSKTPLDSVLDALVADKALLATLKRVLADSRAAMKGKPKVSGDVEAILRKELTAKKTDGTWDNASLAHALSQAAEDPNGVTLSEYMDGNAELSALKYQFGQRLQATFATLDDNVKRILEDRPAFADYVVTLAYRRNIRDFNALMNFALNRKEGFTAIVDYAKVSAARALVAREQLNVDKIDDEDGDFIVALKADDKVPLSKAGFESAVKAIVHQYAGDVKAEAATLKAFLDDKHTAGVLKRLRVDRKDVEAMRPLLLQYMKRSPVRVTAANAGTLIPPFIAQIRGTTRFDEEPSALDIVDSEKDFDVDLFEDDEPQVQISESAVKCAAQLYYGMVLGDELDIFNVVNFFTHKYLVRGQIEIQDRRLRDDLQMYVFSGKFTELKTGKVVDRTRPAERQMFYSQVFNQGSAPGTDDMIVKNDDYPRLWKVLMLESARYLERAQLSPNPNQFVSKTNVMQAVEDLQYNLSTHCVGMASVISPLIHAELDFVIRRILMRDEVRRQVAPSGGSWWRVVEALYMAMKNTRPKATILYNKAKLGNSIIRKIAEYNAASFENNSTFSAFISDVDAFITTQSILQEALTDDLKRTDEDQPSITGPTNGSGGMMPAMPGGPGGSSSGAQARDDWDF